MTGLDWRPDPLGDGWQQATLPVSVADPELVATLVRHGEQPPGPTMLHVHGFNDYFFQRHLGRAAAEAGLAFYALDLRRCGRSWREGQLPHVVADLAEYRVDLALAARWLRALGHDRLVLHAHSTGGLTAALWAASPAGREAVDALVLNSPWFDLNARWFQRVVSTWVLDTLGPLDPDRVLADGPSAYSYHLHRDHGGRWDYDLRLKPPDGFPVRAGWLRAVRRGQARLARGLGIEAPVLAATAAESGPNRLDNPLLDAQDTVLDVRQIWARIPRLGPDVTELRVPGGIHDLTLSADRPRELYLDRMLAWVDENLAARAA
ncbi:alpha/beta hydrolase [Cellulomonas denverensis]|uniref:Alpha/beta hydrolase n=1 Tax=Cellulomonas denverensis TaxID=264297 RepID=A0A7X6QYY1_9CELL|nr:alpha/beta hydrolase [Cellulomonas denverensis]NKY22659.1 alpha/beta hydrolase [Cellulomonas denverensis]GIG24693.1 alpha/beta hydrolase [Cellulomonas denverensis]